MSRPPAVSAEEKTRIVMSILAGELSGRRAARRAKVSEQSVGFWKRRQFLEAGKAGLTATGRRSSTREQQLEAEVADLTQALGGRGRAAGVEDPRSAVDGHMSGVWSMMCLASESRPC